jgi:hypothetical protein
MSIEYLKDPLLRNDITWIVISYRVTGLLESGKHKEAFELLEKRKADTLCVALLSSSACKRKPVAATSEEEGDDEDDDQECLSDYDMLD